MNVMVVEDNFLVGEMIRLAVEDASFDVVGPVATLDDGERLAANTELDGALLDIQLGSTKSFPIARLLRNKGVPFIFVSGYDRTVLPKDLEGAPLVPKPLFVNELTRLATDHFSPPPRATLIPRPAVNAEAMTSRRAALEIRIANGEARIITQRRRVERLQVSGHDLQSAQLSADVLEQMIISVRLMRETLEKLDRRSDYPAGAAILRPISDDMIQIDDPKNLARWAKQFGISIEQLLTLIEEVGPSARLVAKTLAQASMNGAPRKARV